jgi:hypothetical protein
MCHLHFFGIKNIDVQALLAFKEILTEGRVHRYGFLAGAFGTGYYRVEGLGMTMVIHAGYFCFVFHC